MLGKWMCALPATSLLVTGLLAGLGRVGAAEPSRPTGADLMTKVRLRTDWRSVLYEDPPLGLAVGQAQTARRTVAPGFGEQLSYRDGIEHAFARRGGGGAGRRAHRLARYVQRRQGQFRP